MSTALAVVAGSDTKHETVAQRVRRLQDEARHLARDHIREFARGIADIQDMALEIASGGEAYPAGIRDLARRFAEDAEARGQTIEALSGRT